MANIVGIDEVGRGAFAGPIVACAVYFPPKCNLPKNIKDSKLLTEKQRSELAEQLKKVVIYTIACRSADFINQYGINEANQLVWFDAFEKLCYKDKFTSGRIKLYIDGKYRCKYIKYPDVVQIPVINGDKKILQIAAASIIAKDFRDKIMNKLHVLYPEYDWISNKGYGTYKHIASIKQYGMLKTIHRKEFIHFDAMIRK